MLTVSTYQEPDGFSNRLFALDVTNNLKKSEGWRSFRSADIWIYFLNNDDDIIELGGGIPELYRSNFSGSDSQVFFRRLDVETDGGRKIMLLFFFLDGRGNDPEQVGAFVCRASLTTTFEISGFPRNIPLEKVSEKCPKLN